MLVRCGPMYPMITRPAAPLVSSRMYGGAPACSDSRPYLAGHFGALRTCHRGD